MVAQYSCNKAEPPFCTKLKSTTLELEPSRAKPELPSEENDLEVLFRSRKNCKTYSPDKLPSSQGLIPPLKPILDGILYKISPSIASNL